MAAKKKAAARRPLKAETESVEDRGVAPHTDIPEGSERNPLDVLMDKNSTAEEKAAVQERGVNDPTETPEGSEPNPHDVALANAGQK